MLSTRRPGRPARPLPSRGGPVTRALRDLVRQVHGGNVLESARHAGVPYATFRALYRGDTDDPGLGTVSTIAEAYGVPVDWFLGGHDAGREPVAGWIGVLPPDPESGVDPGRVRRVVIPLAAGSLYAVATRLERRLRAMPESARRPIVGGAREDLDFRRRLTTFLLDPILSARAAGEPVPLVADPPLRGEPPLTPERRDEWLRILRRLGDYWQAVYPGD